MDNFFPFYPTNNHKNQNFEKMKKAPGDITALHKSTIIDNHIMILEIWSTHQTWFLSFCTIFCHFISLTTPKTKILKNEKKAGDIILQMCTMNGNHMMYGSWEMERDGQNFLSFWTFFCPFTPVTTKKIIILKKWKKYQEISSFYKSASKIMIISPLFLRYNVWLI